MAKPLNIPYYLRLNNNMKQKELAKKLRVTPETVSNWCRGKYEPSTEMIDAIARILHTTPSKIRMED